MTDQKTLNNIKTVTLDLLAYCKKENWAGWDPYDALNSRLFQLLPFLDFKIPRLVMIQLLKRSPINVRKPLLIPKTQNPKALALFLSAAIKLTTLGLEEKDEIGKLIDKIEAMRSPDEKYFCWGYSFPWQTRDMLVPRGMPNLVCTTFVANALLNAYDFLGDQRCLDMAVSAADYIATDLYYTDGDSVAGYCYPTPDSHSRVHNANFLGAALLCRVAAVTGKARWIDNALKVARYSAFRQRPDGSWDYGEFAVQRWIDNFHTGYNLSALSTICSSLNTTEFETNIHKGFEFYINNFFTEDNIPKYFHNRLYPIDTHAVANSIITLVEFNDYDERAMNLAKKICQWAIDNMQNREGYFYYQKKKYYKNKISYMRWSQAWMLYALAEINSQILN